MKGIIGLYYGFRKHLLKERKKLAVLQCLGRLEEYMTKEFASFIYIQSDRSILPLTNLGSEGEQKIDIALLEGDFSEAISKDNAKIRAFVEVKFLRNLHRVGPGKAEDEIRSNLTNLRRNYGSLTSLSTLGTESSFEEDGKTFMVWYSPHTCEQGTARTIKSDFLKRSQTAHSNSGSNIMTCRSRFYVRCTVISERLSCSARCGHRSF